MHIRLSFLIFLLSILLAVVIIEVNHIMIKKMSILLTPLPRGWIMEKVRSLLVQKLDVNEELNERERSFKIINQVPIPLNISWFGENKVNILINSKSKTT